MQEESLSKEQLLTSIAALASSPMEREPHEESWKANCLDEHVQARLQRHTSLIGTNEEARQRWFELHHLDEARLVALLAAPYEQDVVRPPWIETLDQVLSGEGGDVQEQDGFGIQDRCVRAKNPVPFEELLLPFVRHARQKLMMQVDDQRVLDGVSEEALIGLERWLLDRLSEQAGQALQLEFACYRVERVPLKEDWQQRGDQRGLYAGFVRQYKGENMLLFFRQYSVLARLLIMQIEQWVGTCLELLERLATDRKALAGLFLEGQDLGMVTKIRASGAETHHDGRTVFFLTFTPDFKLVYKPRSMDVDRAFFALLRWINASEMEPDLQELRVLNRDSHGWMEYVKVEPCQSPQEVCDYYLRAGTLVCLLYVLGSTDMHFENLIASGAYPMVVDLETILTPGALVFSPNEKEDESSSEQGTKPEFSVQRAGLLPGIMIVGQGEETIDLGGLVTISEQTTSSYEWQWLAINTDAMVLRKVVRPRKEDANVVVLQGRDMPTREYSEEIVSGFRRMYRFLQEHREELLDERGPLAAFAGCSIRYVHRATRIYVKMLDRLRHPKYLRNGADRWLELLVFEKPLLKTKTTPNHWALIEAERQALERLDVPFFRTRTDRREIWPDRGPRIKEVQAKSALEMVRSCLEGLSEEDMRHQIESIRAAFVKKL